MSGLDEECIAALKEVAAAEKTSTPVNALTGNMTEYPMQLGHLLFEGYIENDESGNLSLTQLGRAVVRCDNEQRAIEQGAVERFTFSFGEDVRRRATEKVPPRQDIKLVFYRFDTLRSVYNAYNFAARLARAAKRPREQVTNWRVPQEVVDRSWEAQDKVRVGSRSTFRAENARRWVDESLRRAREAGLADG